MAIPSSIRALCKILLALSCAVVLPAHAQLKFIETADLKVVYYDPATAYVAPAGLRAYLGALDADRKLFGYIPDGQLTLLLSDFDDRGGAGINTVPHNKVLFSVAAASEPFESYSKGDRFALTGVHEAVHLVFNDYANSTDRRFRSLFGGKVDVDAQHPESLLYYYLTSPRATAPRWYQEGMATFAETWQMGGVGRAQGGYDEMVFRGMVDGKVPFFDPLALVSKGTMVDFRAGANAYLYGTRFMSYLALTYGPDKLVAWWKRDEGSQRYYAAQFQQVFGLPLPEAWQAWVRAEHEFQAKNLASIRQHPITPAVDVTSQTLGAVSRHFVSADGSKVYAAVKYPGQVPRLVSISSATGKVNTLLELKGSAGLRVASVAYDPAGETLFFTTNNARYRNLEALDLRTGKARVLLQDARIGDLAFNPVDRSLWGLRRNRGFVILVRVPYPYVEFKTIKAFPFPANASDLDISPDGTQLSMSYSGLEGGPDSAWISDLRVMNLAALEKGDATPTHRLRMGSSVPEGFTFSHDGQYLYGSSYFTGVSNIFRYRLADKALDAVSNADIGFFHPVSLPDGKLMVLRYAGTGFLPAVIEPKPTEELGSITFLGEQVATRYPAVLAWQPKVVPEKDYDARIIARGDYQPVREMELNYFIPGIAAYKQAKAVGLSAQFSDPLSRAWLKTDLSYTPGNSLPVKERTHFSLDMAQGLWSAGVKWNAADFYDLFGPTLRSREGYSAYVKYDRPLVYDPPQTLDFYVHAAYYGGLNALPGAQTVASPSHLSDITVGLVSSDTLRSPGAVDAESGSKWSIEARSMGARGKQTPSLRGQYDFGIPLPLNHSSIWVRSGFNIAEGSANSPLSNAYLGSFGNNYVDNAANGGAQRYRDLLSMPGFDIDALQGKTLVKTMVEWSLPPLNFENVGTPGAYASWMRPEIFVSYLATDLQDKTRRRNAASVGMQLDFELQVMHRLPMMFSLGFARGFGGGGLGKNEVMLSFQVL
jgi:hypothetical protein